MRAKRREDIFVLKPRLAEVKLGLPLGRGAHQRPDINDAPAERILQQNAVNRFPDQFDSAEAGGFIEDVDGESPDGTIGLNHIEGRGLIRADTHHAGLRLVRTEHSEPDPQGNDYQRYRSQ
jgi:hypothetical protein